MAKLPFMKWYPGDWLSDPAVSKLRPGPRAIWFDALNHMHQLDQCGELKGTLAELARLCRCTVGEVREAITELKKHEVAEISEHGNGVVALVNRRMKRAYQARKSNSDRQKRLRSKSKGNLSRSCRAKSNALVAREKLEARSQKPEARGSSPPNPPEGGNAAAVAASVDFAALVPPDMIPLLQDWMGKGYVGGLQLQFLGERIGRFGVDCVRRAIQLHVQRGTAVGNWNYLDAILSGGAKDSTKAQRESDEIRQRLAELEKRGIKPLKAGEA